MRNKLKMKRVFWKIYLKYKKSKALGYLCCLLTASVLLLCSCQNKPQVTVYIGPSSGQNIIDELRVKEGKYQEALERCQEKLQQIQEDSLESADVYSIMGEIYAEYLEDSDNAVHYINKAIEIHQRENDELGLALDYQRMSKKNIYIDNDVEEGLRYLEQAEQIYNKYGVTDAFELASLYADRGEIYMNESQYEDALQAFKNAQEIYEKRQETNISFHILTGQVYLKMQEYTLAEEEYLEAQQICIDENDQYSMAKVDFQLGWLYGSKDEYSRAIEYYYQALEFYQKTPIYLYDAAGTFNNIAYAYVQLGELEKALEMYVNTCRAIEKVKLTTSEMLESKNIYKSNLNMCYKGWSEDMTEEGFEIWYQETVLKGMDWKA